MLIQLDANGNIIPSNVSTANADGVSNTTISPAGTSGATIYNRDLPYVFNGSGYDRQHSTSATNLTASINAGASLVEKGPRWSVFSGPTTGSQASASKAAGGAGVRHVVDCITFSGVAVFAPALTFSMVNLRDGASGAGTVKTSASSSR